MTNQHLPTIILHLSLISLSQHRFNSLPSKGQALRTLKKKETMNLGFFHPVPNVLFTLAILLDFSLIFELLGFIRIGLTNTGSMHAKLRAWTTKPSNKSSRNGAGSKNRGE